jgi:hypothetical protein
MKLFIDFNDEKRFIPKLKDIEHIDFSLFLDCSPKNKEELSSIREEMKEVCNHNQQNFIRLYGLKYGSNNINKEISNLINNVWKDLNIKSFNLVYDVWQNNNPISNGSIYYDNKWAFNDGDSLLNHTLVNVKKGEFLIKKYKLNEINEYGNFFYIINHQINPTFITKENEDFVITNEVIEKLKQYKNFKLLLITEHEPIDENVFVLINNYFIKKNVNLSQIYCINNNSKLEEYKKKYNSDINVYKINFLLFCKIRDMRDGGGCEFTTNKQGKFFMTFNKSIKPHRTALLCLLMKYNLIDHVNWSFISNRDETIHPDFMEDVINEDKELGEPDSVETYTIGDVTYEKKIWEVDGGQIIKVEIKSDKANGIIEIPITIRPSRFKQSSLEDQLDYAISVEDYEKAAQLRDEIVKRDTVVVDEPKKRGRPKKNK